MGMHHGVLAAKAPLADLLAELTGRGRPLTPGAELGTPYDVLGLRDQNGFTVAAGEQEGRSFIVDTSFLLSSDPDLIVALSRRLGTVIGGGAETVSGTWDLTAARDGDLTRFVFIQHSSTSRGMSLGERLPTEAEHPIEDLDGLGLLAALSSFDLDPRPWLRTGPARVFGFSPERLNIGGPINDLRRQHMQTYARSDADSWLSRLTGVERESPNDGT